MFLNDMLISRINITQCILNYNEMGFATERLVKAKSEIALASAVDNTPVQHPLNKMKSRSLEPLSNFAMWSSEPVVIELKKGDKGLNHLFVVKSKKSLSIDLK
jgi:hypothetical protein